MKNKTLLVALAAGLLSAPLSFGQTPTNPPANPPTKKSAAPAALGMATVIPAFDFKFKKLNYLGLSFSPEIQFGNLAGQFTPMAGATAMLHFNKKFGLGVAAYSTVEEKFAPTALDAAKALGLNTAYGGLKLEYTPRPDARLHVSFPLLIGAGMSQVDSINGQRDGNHDYRTGIDETTELNGRDGHHEDGGTYFVIQPGVNVEANLIRYVKVFLGASYRIVPTVSKPDATVAAVYPMPTAGQLGGVNLSAGLRIGLFDYQLHRRRKASATE